MVNQETLINETAKFKKESEDHFNEALAALLLLAWPYRKAGFTFSENPAVYSEAIAICLALSDKCADSAKKRLLDAIAGELENISDEEAVAAAYGESEQASFDMAGTHLLELLEVWIGVAVASGWTMGYTRVMISRYLSNPFLCPEWKSIPLETLSWGRGYERNISNQLALIGQGIILSGARSAEWSDEQAKGATFYIRRRGSAYDCPLCESLANTPIPISTPWEYTHPRCCCYPEYHYEPML